MSVNVDVNMCEEIFKRFGTIKGQIWSTSNLMKTEHIHARTCVFLPSVRKIIGLYIMSIASSSISNGRIHFGAIGGAILPEWNGRKESGRERGVNLRRERGIKRRGKKYRGSTKVERAK